MDIEVYRTVYGIMISTAFFVSAVSLIGYSVLARWIKSSMGIVVWGQLLTITLVLMVPFLHISFGSVPFRREMSVVFMAMFIVVQFLVAYGIYNRQIKGYLKYRKLVKERSSR